MYPFRRTRFGCFVGVFCQRPNSFTSARAGCKIFRTFTESSAVQVATRAMFAAGWCPRRLHNGKKERASLQPWFQENTGPVRPREKCQRRVHIHCCHLKTCTHLSETEIPEEFRSSSLFPVICFNGEIIPLHTAFGKKPQRVLRYTKRSKFYSLGRCIKAPKVVFVKHTCGESAHNWWFHLLA